MATNQPKNFGRKPIKVITIPREFRTESLRTGIHRLIQDWKAEFDIDVVPQFDGRRIIQFDLFGPSVNLDATIRAVNKWIKKAHEKTANTNAWPKMSAFDENKWYYGTIEKMESERKEIFKGPIPEDCPHLFKGTGKWPKELLERVPAVTPRDAFGNKLDALDSIRLDDEVFISLRPPPNPNWEVEIYGLKVESVEAAEEHYSNLAQKVLSKTLSGSTTLNIVLDEEEGKNIVLERAQAWWPIKSDKIVPRLDAMPVDDPGSYRRQSFGPTMLDGVREALTQSFEAIRYSRGSYDLAIRFGCIALQGLTDTEIGKTYPIHRFKQAIDGRIPCHAKKWLYSSKDGEQLLKRLMSATHLLEPVKSSSGLCGFSPSSLNETRPTYRGTWAFHDPDSRVGRQKNAPVSLVVVQIDWAEDEDGMYEKMPVHFYRLKTGAPTEHMDINLLELSDSKVWHFGLESMDIDSKYKVPSAIRAFSDAVSMRSGISQDSEESFARWPKSSSLQLHFGRLEKIYTFGIIKTGYRVEVAALWYPGGSSRCWGLAVRHRDWEMHLNQLERMPQGRGADWKDPTRTFFPDDGLSASETKDEEMMQKFGKLQVTDRTEWEGIRLLTGKLMDLSYVVNLNTDLTAAQKGPSLGKGLAMRDSALISLMD